LGSTSPGCVSLSAILRSPTSRRNDSCSPSTTSQRTFRLLRSGSARRCSMPSS
jgi:hypothetical protein